ncbi:nucleobase:cation symporter-2 family protein [Saxibacter everestensis]|uniref:Nucleobase:cation symporter-2 family protein n=1 Tax=Saxibacter everestensis TaxID=2909229 RepID=A0ABY8QSQ3_9MICO|nr:nucleobase:cation symporter-2 family protein [Brevibacteriaceae bacterium ZFBP1038]
MVKKQRSANQSAVDERLPFPSTVLLGMQHILVMYAGVVVVPIIVGASLGLTEEQIADLVSIDLILSGIGTILQALGVWKFGIRMPLVVGAASNGIVPMVLVGEDRGLPTVYGSLLVVGVIWMLIAPFFSRLLRFFPAVVTGTVIALIGLTLIPIGLRLIAGPDPAGPGYGDPKHIGLAALTMFLMVVFYRVFRGLLGQLSILLALVIGSIVGWATGIGSLAGISDGPVIGMMRPFHFGGLEFHVPSILLFLVIVFVLMVEGTGQGLAVGQVVGKKVGPEEITRLLRVDGLMTAISGVFNGFAYTTFGQNIGLIALTKVRSRYPVIVGGVLLVALGIFQPIGRVVAAIPQPVVGAAAVVTFAALAVAGLQILGKVDFNQSSNLVIVMLALGVGLVPAGAPAFYTQFPDWCQIFLKSGVASGTIIAVSLNIVFHVLRRSPPAPEEPVPAEPSRLQEEA